MKVLAAQSCLTLCDPVNCSLPGSSVHGIGSYSLLHEIFQSQELNLGHLYSRQILYHLSHQASPKMKERAHRKRLPERTSSEVSKKG